MADNSLSIRLRNFFRRHFFTNALTFYCTQAREISQTEKPCRAICEKSKRFRRDAIARLQDEQSKLQNRLDKLYEDRLDGFIEPDFFERESREWRQTQKRLADQIGEYENAAHDYVQDGVRLLELAKKAYFLFKQQNSSEKEIAEFRVFELHLEGSNSHRNLAPTL